MAEVPAEVYVAAVDAYIDAEGRVGTTAAVGAVIHHAFAAGRAQAAADIRAGRDDQFACIEQWAKDRDIRGYLVYADIEQLVANLEALPYAAGGAEGDPSKALNDDAPTSEV